MKSLSPKPLAAAARAAVEGRQDPDAKLIRELAEDIETKWGIILRMHDKIGRLRELNRSLTDKLTLVRTRQRGLQRKVKELTDLYGLV